MSVARNFFQRIPFIRITGLFLAGILINHFILVNLQWIGIILAGLISISIFFWHNSNYSSVRIQNFIIVITVFISGIFYPGQFKEKPVNTFDRKDYFLAEVCQKPVEKTNTYQTTLIIQNQFLPKTEKIVAYFSKPNFDSTITIGDQLVILGIPQEIKNLGNPFEFDYQSMMRKRQFFYSVYLTEGNYLKTNFHENRLTYKAEKIREKLLLILKQKIGRKEEFSVISALTLGYRAELDRETIDYFSSTGAMHVLAVSGLHVGLIYFILGFLLSFMKRFKCGTFLFSATMLTLLWSYAFITGFSASVQRATVMFSFIIIGEILRRPVNIYNSLCASALVLMLLNPQVPFEVGFQLSYIAVLGIVLIQPKLSGLIIIKNKLLKFLWALFTVSLAAQLVTFPLGLYYFNQFPNLFWLSNFIVIPAATVIIWLTFGFYISSSVEMISQLLAKGLQLITGLLIEALKFLSNLPHAVSQGLVISAFQVWIIYGILIVIITYAFTKKKQWLFYTLILILVQQASVLASNSRLFNQKAIYIYNSKNTLIHLINGRNNYLITNGLDTIPEIDLRIVMQVKNNLKIDEPIIINWQKNIDAQWLDLIIRQNKIQFLITEIELLNSQPTRKTKADNFIVSTAKIENGKSYNKTSKISTGYGHFKIEKNDTGYFSTKQNGSFHLNLK